MAYYSRAKRKQREKLTEKQEVCCCQVATLAGRLVVPLVPEQPDRVFS
jgi:hypothetical protein